MAKPLEGGIGGGAGSGVQLWHEPHPNQPFLGLNETDNAPETPGPQHVYDGAAGEEQRGLEVLDRAEEHRKFQQAETSACGRLKRSMFEHYTAVIYAFTNLRRDKLNFSIGVFTVFIVVFFGSLLQNSIEQSPIVFLKLAEDNVGETDLMLTPRDAVANDEEVPDELAELVPDDLTLPFIDEPLIEERTKNTEAVVGVAPRWVTLARAVNPGTGKNVTSAILVMDSDKEEDIGLGRSWNRRSLGETECYVSASVLRTIGVKGGRGERVRVVLDVIGLAEDLGILEEGDTQTLVQDALEAQGIDLTFTQTINVTALVETVNVTQLLEAFGVTNVTAPDLDPGTQEVDINGEVAFDTIYPIIRQLLVVQREFTVVDGIDKPQGKWPTAIGNVVVLEKRFFMRFLTSGFREAFASPFLRAILDSTSPGLNENVDDALASLEEFDFDSLAFTVVAMWEDRLTAYVKTDKALDQDVISFTNDFSEAIGYRYPASFSTPLVLGLFATRFVRLFLDQIFLSVLIVLIILGSILIYSLLLSDVEDKTYEYGMLRALGLRQPILVFLLVLQGLMYAIPGISMGLLAAYVCGIPVEYGITTFSVTPMTFRFHWSAAVVGLSVGFFMPLIANYVPIRRALGKTLRDSLDLYHNVVSETQIRKIKLAKLGLSPTQLGLSVLMVVAGFVVFYIVPYSFQFRNFALFLTILTLVLLGMLLGLGMIASMLQPYAELVVLWFLLYGKEKKLKTPVKKNMSSHRNRNKKTALMFTISTAFVIFAGASFALQGRAIRQGIEMFLGADLVVTAPLSFLTGGENEGLPVTGLRSYLDGEIARGSDSRVVDYTFITYPLQESDWVDNTRLETLARFPRNFVTYFGVERNFLNVAYNQFYTVSELDEGISYSRTSDGRKDAIESMYSSPSAASGTVPPTTTTGYIEDLDSYNKNQAERASAYTDMYDVIISEALRMAGSVDVATPVNLRIKAETDTYGSKRYLGKVRAMLSKLPGFFFSSYRIAARNSPVLVTMDQYSQLESDAFRLSKDVNATSPIPPMQQRLLVRMIDGSTMEDREQVVNGLRNFFDNDDTVVTDTKETLQSTELATQLLQLFFVLVSTLASVLCFFLLLLSVSANMRENAWEFGVMRALGLTANQMIRMYIYESVSMIFSALVFGTVIGIALAVTLTLQFNLFTEFPFIFEFPYEVFFSLVAMAFTVAILGSVIPVKRFGKNSISNILKRAN